VLGVPVKSEHSEMSRHSPESIELALGIGMPTRDPISGLIARRALAARYEARGYRFPALVHPSAIIGAEFSFGEGTQVMAGAVVQPSCTIAPFAIVNITIVYWVRAATSHPALPSAVPLVSAARP
jgi:hypothetical protein